MSTNYSLLFYLKKSKNYVSGPKPIYMRITVDGIPKEVSTGKDCDPSKWNSRGNRAKGTTENVKTLNSYLDTIEHKIAEIHLQMAKNGSEITSESIKLKYLGKDIQRKFEDIQKRPRSVEKDNCIHFFCIESLYPSAGMDASIFSFIFYPFLEKNAPFTYSLEFMPWYRIWP